MFSHFVRMAAGYLTYLVGGGETPPPVGTLWVFGNNTNGELGDNTTASKSSPIQTVAGGNDWTVVDGYNAFSSAAIKDDGSLWLWGSDTYGQLGDNSTTNKSSPVQTVSGGTDWAKVECGYHTVAVKTDGTLWTWGKDQYGQLGDNTTTNKSSPVQTVAGGTDWADVSCGYGESAAIKTDGTLWTWGGNSSGQLGDNTRTNKSSPVQTVAGGTDWKQCDLGSFFMGAIKTDGTLWTWGANSQGSLGDNTTAAKSSPVQTVAGGTDWKQLSCGGTHAAAIKTDGTLWLWGQNNNGQLGDNSSTRKSSPVQTVAGGTDWKYVSCGSNHTMAVKTDGTLWGWGDGYYGQLGNDSYGFGARRSSPVQTVAGGTKWGYVTAGHRHTLAIVTVLSGSIWSWGDNTYGELGDNSTTDKSSPVQTLITTEDWITVSRGNNHTAAIRRDGTLWVWGRNDLGQLGDNTTTPKSSPVQTVAGGTDWADVVCGTHHVLAMKNDGSLWTWGYNNNGELGDNTTMPL